MTTFLWKKNTSYQSQCESFTELDPHLCIKALSKSSSRTMSISVDVNSRLIRGKSGSAVALPVLPGPHRANAPTGYYDCSRRNPNYWRDLGYRSANDFKSSDEFQDECWSRWPTDAAWPRVVDVYEAAARLRTSPSSIRREATIGRDGKAKLAHQRLGATYRFRLQDIDNYGLVQARVPTTPATEGDQFAADSCRHRGANSEASICQGAVPARARRSQRRHFPRPRS